MGNGTALSDNSDRPQAAENRARARYRALDGLTGSMTSDLLQEADTLGGPWHVAKVPKAHGVPYCILGVAPGSTAATPSGLILNAKNVSGSLPGFPH
jgi:hypothetical protein